MIEWKGCLILETPKDPTAAIESYKEAGWSRLRLIAVDRGGDIPRVKCKHGPVTWADPLLSFNDIVMTAIDATASERKTWNRLVLFDHTSRFRPGLRSALERAGVPEGVLLLKGLGSGMRHLRRSPSGMWRSPGGGIFLETRGLPAVISRHAATMLASGPPMDPESPLSTEIQRASRGAGVKTWFYHEDLTQ